MPISIIELDSSTKEENITLILGKNILLKIIEDLEKQTLLSNNTVKKFVSITDLCHDDIRLLVDELIEREPLLTNPNLANTLQLLYRSKYSDSRSEIRDLTIQHWMDSVKKTPSEEFSILTSYIVSNLFLGTKGEDNKKLIQKENKRLASIGDRIKGKTGFEILVPSNLLLCPKCKVVLSTEEFRHTKKCYVCNTEVTRENAERICIHKVHEKVKEVWKKNLWFEAYMARLLRKLDCKTWTSVHVMGASGILHEIDVLAIRNGTILVCECKTGKVSRNDVFNFCTKVGDLKAHVSILALIGNLPESETREFVKKNPAIIRLEDMGKMKEVDILTDLRQSLSIKA